MDKSAELLLGCLRREEKIIKLARLNKYGEEEWKAVLTLAITHGTGPVLYNTIKPFAPAITIPLESLEGLREAYFSAAARNMRLYQQLLQTVSLFNRHGINVILLKGAHLAEGVYGNIALRSMSDVDLLVRKNDLQAVHEILVNDGYSYAHEGSLSNTKHLPPYRKEKGVCLEIHFHITDPPYADRININEMWQRACQANYQGVDVLTLSLEDLYLHLCLHSALQHGFDTGLVSCLDITALIENNLEKIDWELLWKRGREWGIERSIFLMAALAERMLGVPIPSPIAGKIETGGETDLAIRAAEKMIFSRGTGAAPKGAGTTRYLARLFGNQGWRVKLAYIKQRAFPPGETLYKGKGPPETEKGLKHYLLYFKRVRDLLRRHGKTVWRGLLGNPDIIAAMDAQNEKNKLRDWLAGA